MPTPWFKLRIDALETELRKANADLSNALARVETLEAELREAVAEPQDRPESKPLNPGPDLDASPWLR